VDVNSASASAFPIDARDVKAGAHLVSSWGTYRYLSSQFLTKTIDTSCKCSAML